MVIAHRAEQRALWQLQTPQSDTEMFQHGDVRASKKKKRKKEKKKYSALHSALLTSQPAAGFVLGTSTEAIAAAQ